MTRPGREASPLRVVIAGGGTGGHVYPGIAVARELARRRPDASISFAGTASGLEGRVVPQEGFPLDVIRSGALKGKCLASRLRGIALLPLGFVDAWRLVSARRPSVVIGVGGYSSGPIVLVAALRGVPTIVLEQNAVPGLTNRWLSRVVDAAAVTYPETRAHFGSKAFVSGTPVRAEFAGGSPARGPGARERPGGAEVLVFGGSQGAHAINVAMVEAARNWQPARPASGSCTKRESEMWRWCGPATNGPASTRKSSRSSTTWGGGWPKPT